MRKRSISFSSILGFAVGIFCIVYAIYHAGNAETFFDITSVFITIGGTLGSVIIAYPPSRLKNMSADEAMRKELLVEGLSASQEGKTPRILREELLAYMSRKEAQSTKFRMKIQIDEKPEIKKVSSYGNRQAL